MAKLQLNPRCKIIASFLACAACLYSLHAQELPEASPLGPKGDHSLLLLPGEEIMLTPTAPPLEPAVDRPFKLKLAPVEIRPVLPPLSSAFGVGPATELSVFVKGFRFKGNSVFRAKALEKALASFVNRKVTSAELEQARQDLTLLYVNAGYINSGALLEDQDFTDGIVVFTLVEGRLTDIKVEGNWWLRSWWLRNAIRHSAGTPLNMKTLKQGLELLRQDPNIRQINAELMPGGKPGESMLDLKVKEKQPFRFSMEFSNRRPPSVGSEIVELNASMLNLTGHSDPIVFRYGLAHSASETMDQWEWSGADNLEGSYQFPITPWKTTLEVHASRNDSSVIEEAFQALNITSRFSQFGATLRQPLYETLNNLFAVSATADSRKNDTFLLNRRFSLSPGAINGETKDFVLRFALEYVNRTEQHVMALRSTFNIGLDAFGATQRPTVSVGSGSQGTLKLPDGEFFSWLGQGQFVQRLFNTDNLAILRVNAYLSDNPLLSLEQFSIGGMQSVRGYRENELLRDNGIFGSLEFHLPLWRHKDKSAIFTLAPFFDIGTGWDNAIYTGPPPKGGPNRRKDTLASVGVGVIFTPNQYVNAQIFWGYALNREFVATDGNNLQDYGIHFALSVFAF